MTTMDPTKLLPVVSKLARAYTSNESTSISYEKAMQLMEAVLYCINEVSEENLPASAAFKEEEYALCYEMGYQHVLKKVEQTLSFYNQLLSTFQSYDLLFLKETILDGMPAFFLRYDPKFNPQDHLLTLDYTTILDLGSLCGVDRIQQYLQYIAFEQDFIACLPTEYVFQVLSAYHHNYKELPINLAELLYHHLLFCLLIDCPIETIQFKELDAKKAAMRLLPLSDAAIKEKLNQLSALLMNQLGLPSQSLQAYFHASLPSFFHYLKNGITHDCLLHYFHYEDNLSQNANFSSKYAFKSSIFIRSCSMVSRSRTVTA